jgi:AbrB family looped-hinge helix DNA binding protein
LEATSVTSKGQVTIPIEVRQRLGIRQGSKIQFAVVGDHVEMRLSPGHVPASPAQSGYGLLKSRRAAVPTSFDPASLLKK